MADPVVAICIPVYDSMKHATWRSLQNLWIPHGGSNAMIRGVTHKLDTHGLLIEHARRTLTDGALGVEPRVTHLLWIDADMTFPEYALKRLLDHDKDIVGGLCFNRRAPVYQPVLLRHFPEWTGQPERLGFVYHYPPDDLIEVDATGGAFLLVKREVFEAISERYGYGTWWEPLQWSEDISFCHRARQCGFKVHVDTGLKIGHVGEIVVDETFALRNREFEWDAWAPEVTHLPEGQPRASIVIPTYNQYPKYLKAAILSAAYQSVPVEVIVVDDGSNPPVPTEGWPENVRVIRQDNKGVAGALNTGIEHMQTDWFCWLSSDDMIDSRKVERQLTALTQSGCKAGFHRYQVVLGDEPHSRTSIYPEWKTIDEQRRTLAEVCAINGSTVMIHRDVFEDVGRFDESYRYGQDWEMWCRIGQKYFWFGLPEILGTRRDLPSNLTNSIERDEERNAVARDEDLRIRERYKVEP